MMYRLQFTLTVAQNVRALAWPYDFHGELRLTDNIFNTILYGSEDLAIEDIPRWCQKFPQLGLEAEIVMIPLEGE